MAYLANRNGWYSIQFRHPTTGKSCTIAAGTKDQGKAQLCKQRIESIVGAMIADTVADRSTMTWLASTRNKRIRKALIGYGLIEGGTIDQPAMTLEAFLTDYEGRRSDVKPLTKTNWQKAFRNLKVFFGPVKPIASIQPNDARAFERYLKSKKTSKPDAKPLAPATIAKQIGHAKQFFADAVECRLIESNPFDVLKISKGKNKSREFFVTREMTAQVVDACPDAQWRLIVSLCRYAGLRCPSEVLAVTWDDVDWERKRIRIASTKTEHHEGGGERIIPLFPELVDPLKDCFDIAGVGIETPSSERLITRYSDSEQNLRTMFEKIIKRAKLKKWPKMFQNLRASRATELVQEFPQHIAAAWLGHSIKVAAQHYWQIRESDFEKAVTPRRQFVVCDDVKTGFHELTPTKNPRKNEGSEGEGSSGGTRTPDTLLANLPKEPGISIAADSTRRHGRRQASLDRLAAMLDGLEPDQADSELETLISALAVKIESIAFEM
jgi:integrase